MKLGPYPWFIRVVDSGRVGVSEGTRMSKISVHFQAGMDAYERGDYGTALNTFRPLAEQGEAQAQFKLGVGWECPAGPFAESGSGKPQFLMASGTLCDH